MVQPEGWKKQGDRNTGDSPKFSRNVSWAQIYINESTGFRRNSEASSNIAICKYSSMMLLLYTYNVPIVFNQPRNPSDWVPRLTITSHSYDKYMINFIQILIYGSPMCNTFGGLGTQLLHWHHYRMFYSSWNWMKWINSHSPISREKNWLVVPKQ